MEDDQAIASSGPIGVVAYASLAERRARTLKHGDTFAVLDPNGDLLTGPGSADGLYHRDTRHLSRFDLRIDGRRPILLSSIVRDDNAALIFDLTNPDIGDDRGDTVLEHDLVHVRRTKFLFEATAFERISVRSFATVPLELSLRLGFAADFADLFETRGARRPRRGRQEPPDITESRVLLRYAGLDGRERVTRLRFEPAPDAIAADSATWRLALEPGAQRVLYVEVACASGDPAFSPRANYLRALVDARRALRASLSRTGSVSTSNEHFDEALARARADLAMLATDTEHGPYPYAGTPWFSAVFGRDALITALQTLWLDPALARGVLRFLAAHQATEEDPARDAEPGKILHEMRHGEMAALGEVPFARYYGSVDATPLFVVLAGAYLDRTGDLETLRALWPHIDAALRWMATHGDRDGDGFVEYERRSGSGLVNQGWKDSHDSVFHENGATAHGPIALCEVQAYVYAAKRAAAAIAARVHRPERALELEEEARALAARFDAAFWQEDLGTYALALDGAKRPCRIRTSNAGHALFAGIAAPARAVRVASTLMSANGFSGWGVRTLARGEARYNPISYHNGSVWPHDNALVAMGLARYGLKNEAARILDGLFHAATYMDLRRLPELFCGFPRRRGQGPTLYPVACAPQAWAAAAPMALLGACLGISVDPGRRVVRLDRPVLPRFLDEVSVRRLPVGDDRVDLTVRRAGEEVVVHALSRPEGVCIETVA
ncbi:glycogen debranching N-terminal domain-containing protein [Salinarimonas rosea]|uniref:amylo-alpha-1,6-glucosidase n=1 Tax=Salinarimonas rosea TaxID=552063 RepID=UPI000421B12B|nr:glycogen debranching N-terminal domain-containing protein [Salinarimonas rosea]